MKCILLLFTLVALCYSYPYRGEYSKVNIDEYGTIVINGADGKKIVINKGIGSLGQKTVDISVSGPNIPTKRVQINEESDVRVSGNELNNVDSDYLRDKRSSKDSKKLRGSQSETLTKILSRYQGTIDQPAYQDLLREIDTAVQSGRLSSSVYDVLKTLNQEQELEQGRLWGQQQEDLRQADLLDLLRGQAIQRDLQQWRQYQPLLDENQGTLRSLDRTQQAQLPYDLRLQYSLNSGRPIGVQDVYNTPVRLSQQETIDRAYLAGQQPLSSLRSGRLISGIQDLDVTRQQRLGKVYPIGIESRPGRTLWSGPYRNLLSSSDAQSQSIPAQFLEVIGREQQERELLDKQRLIQQQQLQQQQQLLQQQQLYQQQLLQQDQQQRQQLLLQQLQQQRLQQQEQLLPQRYQQQQPLLLNSVRPIQRVQQDLWQQQPGIYSLAGLYGGYRQDIPLVQRYNVPLVL